MLDKKFTLKMINKDGKELMRESIKIKPGSLVLVKIKDGSIPKEQLSDIMNAFKQSLSEGDNCALAYYADSMEIEIIEMEDNKNVQGY